MTLFPMSADAGIVGVVEVLTSAPPEDDIRAMARGVLGVFRNMLTLLDYSESDTLTGLLNRKSFDETFYKASALPLSHLADDHAERRQMGPLRYWLGVIDIDHFKLVNDHHGHLIGDEVLLLSRVMRQSFRFLDKLYRFGGEEFVILMRCHSEDDAHRALERLRHNVDSHVFPRVEHVTVSVGFTDVRVGDTPPSAVERADLAVYHAKRHGRNQVRSHAALVREGELADTAQDSDIELF
jgi:diguanylate cyclase (GGDEF)-like protein